MTERRLDAPTEELKKLFGSNCFFLAGAGVHRFPLAHGDLAKIEADPEGAATYSTFEYIPPDERLHILRTDVSLYADGSLERQQGVVYLDKSRAVNYASGFESMEDEILHREGELESVSATELQEVVDFLSLVVKSIVNRKS